MKSDRQCLEERILKKYHLEESILELKEVILFIERELHYNHIIKKGPGYIDCFELTSRLEMAICEIRKAFGYKEDEE